MGTGMAQKIWTTVKYITMASIVIVFIYIPFANPDMTNTRLLFEFWPYYLVGSILLLLLMFDHADA